MMLGPPREENELQRGLSHLVATAVLLALQPAMSDQRPSNESENCPIGHQFIEERVKGAYGHRTCAYPWKNERRKLCHK